MKVFIWLFCFFVVAVIQTAAREAGLILGAIPAMLLFGLAWWSAKKLCSLWDQHQAEKAALAISESLIPDPLPAEQEPTITAPATPKLRYCKLCGAPIDPKTRKCTGCSKQYFRPPILHKKHLFIGVGVLACAAVVILIFNFTAQLNAAESKIKNLNAQLEALNTELVEQKELVDKYTKVASSYSSSLGALQEKYDELRKLNDRYKEDLFYCEDYCAYIVPTSISGINSGGLYHRLNCPYAGKIENLVIIEISYLESKGYKSCSHCYN